MISIRLMLFTMATVISFLLTALTGLASAVTTVNCAAGDTIAAALAQDNVVIVLGTCNENVTINRDDVILRGDPSGGTVNGPDATLNTILVTADRVLIDGLTVTGGRNGITGSGAGRLTIQNCTVTNTGFTGISFYQGANGTVDTCTVQNNPRTGVNIEGASATIINSTISQNSFRGVNIANGGSGRIGITNFGTYAGNTISNNALEGVGVVIGSSAFIGGNSITGNGTDPSTTSRYGILVAFASADIVGGNMITGNAGSGIFALSASVIIGDQLFGTPSMNTINGNGVSAPTNGGIFGFNGSSLDIRDATISGNTGNGVTLVMQSQARMFGDTIQNNSVDGINLTLGSGVLLQTPTVSVTNNAQFGLRCFTSSRFAGDATGITNNGVGNVACGGF